jgi:glycosyltransferase involved in cell wall biosynthesis
MREESFPRVLIISATCFDKASNSRALGAYFYRWPKKALFQIFSNGDFPDDPQCDSYFRISDLELLKKRFFPKTQVGSSSSSVKKTHLEHPSSFADFLYQIGKKKSPFLFLMRKVLWKRSFWNTQEFRNWLTIIQPEAIFVCLSDSFYIGEIASFVSRLFCIPVISCIWDDHLFSNEYRFQFLNIIYRKLYYKETIQQLRESSFSVFVSPKMKRTYGKKLNIPGDVVYIPSLLQTDGKNISSHSKSLVYFGNLALGRYKTLLSISDALRKISPESSLDIFSAEKSKRVIRKLRKKSNIRFLGSIPYDRISSLFPQYFGTVVCESLNDSQAESCAFSLSTKVGDCLSSGLPILAVGAEKSASISFFQEFSIGFVATNKKAIAQALHSMFENSLLCKNYQQKCRALSHSFFSVNQTANQIRDLIFSTVEKSQKKVHPINLRK